MYRDGMEEIPFDWIARLSMLMDRNMVPRGARHVVDTLSFGKALLQAQHIFKHLLGTVQGSTSLCLPSWVHCRVGASEASPSW